MIEFFKTIYQEMMKGNFSFFILIVGLIQVAVMIVVAKREKK